MHVTCLAFAYKLIGRLAGESRQYLRAETGAGDEWRGSGTCLYAAEDLHHLPQPGLRIPGLDS